MKLGYSHDVTIKETADIKIDVPDANHLIIKGCLLYTSLLDNLQSDRGRPYRHDALHQARRPGLDKDIPRQAGHCEALSLIHI